MDSLVPDDPGTLRRRASSPQLRRESPGLLACGKLEKFVLKNHASKLLCRIGNELRDSRMTDVTLIAGDPDLESDISAPSVTIAKIDQNLDFRPMSGTHENKVVIQRLINRFLK
ncbi:unnamed protein product [Protopolystoma xenopodis]|uniref:Uncharacterized protein n=1 Tax=Protopolystoma xenopodis TaxID=117903 RepID=A0A448XQT2_9PLAT|nr:unnamed protein product [Protopolystoma xenopodis]